MSQYVIARLMAFIPSLFTLIVFVVVLVRLLPGDAIDIMLEENPRGADTSRDEIKARLGIDRSIPEEIVHYTLGIVQGDLGDSVWSREPVTSLIRRRIPVTLKLGVLALSIAASTGILIGIISAVRQDSAVDYVLRSASIVGLSIPNFALATMAIVLPVLWFGWSPSIIYKPPSDGFAHYQQFLFPAMILGLSSSATLMRITRTSMLEVIRQDYIRTARAKGLAERRVIFQHALRNAMIPVVSLLGLQVAGLVGGTVIIESVFSLPGMGRMLISSIADRDYPIVQGVTFVTGLAVMLTNLTVDISYTWLDPRARV